jgi:hypothetical protein
MTLMQLVHSNVQIFITAIGYHIWLNFTRIISASGAGLRSTLERRSTSEIYVPVEVKLTVTVPEKRWNHKYELKSQ